MRRLTVCSLLMVSLVCGQDLRVPAPMSIRQLEQDGAKVFRQNAGTTPQPAVVKEKKKSRKGLWIGLAVAGAATVAVLVAADKRLGNEGHGIFR